MAFEEYDIGTDEIRIGNEGYQKELKNPYSHYDEDPEEKAEDIPSTFNGGEKERLVSLILNTPAVQGSVAKPSQATRNKAYFKDTQRFAKKEDGLHVLGLHFPQTIGRCEDTLQYDGNYRRVTDYHKAMIDLIARKKENVIERVKFLLGKDAVANLQKAHPKEEKHGKK